MSVLSDYILSHVNIFDLADRYGFYSGPRLETFILCPFHSEDTPSARIYRDGLLFCFGCNKMYDPIRFIMGIEDLSYSGAIKWLQEEYEFTIPPEYFTAKVDPGEKEEIRKKVMALKYLLPYRLYVNTWKLFDEDSLTEDRLKDIILSHERGDI